MSTSVVCKRTEDLRNKLETLLGVCVDLKLNQNTKTVISVLEKRPGRLRMSIHTIFLEAPKEVLEATARFVGGARAKPCKLLHFYIHEKMKEHRAQSARLKSPVVIQGACFDLEEEWSYINKEYFNSSVELHVSWYGRSNARYRGSATVGQFDANQNLIRVHRLLDDFSVPRYYLHFVLYHEALHKLYPPYLDSKGVLQIHHREFKFHEKRFKDYHRALKWEQSAKLEWFAA